MTPTLYTLEEAKRIAAQFALEMCRETRRSTIEDCAQVAEDHYMRLDKNGFSEHGSQCLIGKGCSGSIAKAIRALAEEVKT